MKVEQWPIERITPYARNPRRNADAVDKVAASLKEYGFRQPIVVDKDGVIVVGHTRLMAARKLGLEAVPVHVADGLSKQQIKAYRLADNRVHQDSTWDNELLRQELGALLGDGEDIEPTGFSEKELDDLFGEDYEIEEVSVSDVMDEYWISIRGPIEEQAQALQAVQSALQGLRGTTVDLGTINLDL